jgi:hypothetical protein
MLNRVSPAVPFWAGIQTTIRKAATLASATLAS